MTRKKNDSIIFTADKSRLVYLALILLTVLVIYFSWSAFPLRALAVAYGFFNLFKFQRVKICPDYISMSYFFGLIKLQPKINFQDITKISHGKLVKNYYALNLHTPSFTAILYGAAFSTPTFASIVELILSRISKECVLDYPFYFMKENNTAQKFYIFRKRREIKIILTAIVLWVITMAVIKLLYFRA
jgi:hypothetical protein